MKTLYILPLLCHPFCEVKGNRENLTQEMPVYYMLDDNLHLSDISTCMYSNSFMTDSGKNITCLFGTPLEIKKKKPIVLIVILIKSI